MVMLSLCLAVVLVVGVLGQTDQAPAKCCINHQFSSRLIQFGGTVVNGDMKDLESFDYLKYDFDAKVIWLESHDRDESTGDYTVTDVVLDYNTNKEYITTKDGQCFFTAITLPIREPCVPDNSTFLASTRLGFGAASLDVYIWEYELPMTDFKSWLAVTQDGCIPVAEASIGKPYGHGNDNIMYFTDFSPSIADRASLSVPQNCTTPLPPEAPSAGRRSLAFR